MLNTNLNVKAFKIIKSKQNILMLLRLNLVISHPVSILCNIVINYYQFLSLLFS